MSYLIIPAAGGASHRRVDFGAIAELFVEDEAVTPLPPPARARVMTLLLMLTVPLRDMLTLLGDEAVVRRQRARQADPCVARAFGI